jgi:hypothetical protein
MDAAIRDKHDSDLEGRRISVKSAIPQDQIPPGARGGARASLRGAERGPRGAGGARRRRFAGRAPGQRPLAKARAQLPPAPTLAQASAGAGRPPVAATAMAGESTASNARPAGAGGRVLSTRLRLAVNRLRVPTPLRAFNQAFNPRPCPVSLAAPLQPRRRRRRRL